VCQLIRKFVANLVRKRYLFFVVNGCLISPYYAHKGIPQRSTLNPLLFNNYLKDINTCLHKDSKILQYANVVIFFFRSLNTAHKSVQISLNKITHFLKFRGLDLSWDKSQWIVFLVTDTFLPCFH